MQTSYIYAQKHCKLVESNDDCVNFVKFMVAKPLSRALLIDP